jgi:hypothetical protein
MHHSRTELHTLAVGGSRRGGHVHQGGYRGEIDGRVQHDHVRAATVLNRPVADGAVAAVTRAVGDKPRKYVLGAIPAVGGPGGRTQSGARQTLDHFIASPSTSSDTLKSSSLSDMFSSSLATCTGSEHRISTQTVSGESATYNIE